MPPVDISLHSEGPADRAPVAGAEPTAVAVPRMAILSLPVSLIVLWIAVVLGGERHVDRLGNPVGGDFAMFYVAGQMAARGEWDRLYDEALQQERLLELIPGLPSDTYLPYRYPPLVAIVAAPLARLPYLFAFGLYSTISLGLWIGSICLLTRSGMPRLSRAAGTAVLAIACAPVALQTLIDGQASLIWFAIAAGGWFCVRRERYLAAGCLLALAACKPNVMLLLCVVLCLRYPRLLIGLVPTGLVMLLITVSVAGTEALTAYFDLGRQLAWQPWSVETPYWKVQSLLSWSEPIFGAAARRINVLLGLLAAVTIGLVWRHRQASPVIDVHALCAALLVNALFNPYTPVYDLTLLSLGMLVCCAYAESQGELVRWLGRRDVQCTAALVLVGPILSQGLSKAFECPLQLLPLGLLAAGLYWLGRLWTRGVASACCANA